MNITKTTVTKLRLADLRGLDPVSVYLEDLGPGQGKLTIECFGQSWSAGWPAMGERPVSEFIVSVDTEYLANSLYGSGPRREPDYDQIAKDLGLNSIDYEGVLRQEDRVAEVYGPHWRMELPERESSDWVYLCRIVDVVREAVRGEV